MSEIPMLNMDYNLAQESDLSLADTMGTLCEQYAMCRSEISSATGGVWERIEHVSKEIIRRAEKNDERAMMWIRLDNEHVQEAFEMMCKIPFESATMFDSEPPTARHDGIEQIIDQLQLKIDEENIAEIEDMR